MNTVDSAPAGGAEIGQVIGASAAAMLATAVLALPRLGAPHRPHRLLRRLAGARRARHRLRPLGGAARR